LEIESLQIQLVKDLKMKSSWTWAVGGLYPITGVLMRKGENTKRHIRKDM